MITKEQKAQNLALWHEALKEYPNAKLPSDAEYPAIHLSNPIKPGELDIAYAQGMMRKSELVDGQYYVGSCRNASVAMWNASGQYFTYMRQKFGSTFPENIRHPEDDDNYDLFTPFEPVEPTDAQRITGDGGNKK